MREILIKPFALFVGMNTPFLLKLMETDGVSGKEDSVAKLIQSHIRKFVDQCYVDKMGNLV